MALAGTGRCDDLEIEVLSPDGDEGWELQLLTATATLRFEIAGPRTLSAILRFVESEEPAWEELEVGLVDRAKVEIVRDRESGTSRFWLRVTPDRGFLKLDFADDEARKLAAAVRDACRDLALEAG